MAAITTAITTAFKNVTTVKPPSIPLHLTKIKSLSFSSSSSSKPNTPIPTHDQISHLILDQKSASVALKTFRWASNLPSFTHSQSTYRALIYKLCSFRRFDIAHQLLDEMSSSIGSPPDEDIFITIIRSLGRVHMIRQVIKVPDLMSGFKQKPSLKIFNTILDVLVKEDIDIAREFYRKKMMGNGIEGDDYTYGILMKGLCLTNRIGDGFKLLQIIKSRGVKPNAVIYNTLLHALCKNGKVGRARSLMNEMEDSNEVTYNILISAYCKEDNLVQALVLLEKSLSFGFVPDVITVTKVVELLCRVNRAGEAVEVLERVENNGGAVDLVAYNTLIKGFCVQGKVKVGHHFLKEMERKGCFPNVDTYNVLIWGYCKSGMLDSALDLFHEMKREGVVCNFVSYDNLIKGLCSNGRVEGGFKILEQMEETKWGSRGLISPYNSILYGLYKEKNVHEALEFLTKMDKLFPRAVDWSLKILSLCEEGVIEDAKQVYDQMITEGGVPNALVHDHLIRGFCDKVCSLEALEVMNRMVQGGEIPVIPTVNHLIRLYCSQGKMGSAMKIMEEMVEKGFKGDVGSYNLLIGGFCKWGEFEKAARLLSKMVEKGILPDYFTWSSLLLSLSEEEFWLDKKEVFVVDNLVEVISIEA